MDASSYAELQGAIVRMVVPMLREFGIALDVQRMRCDIDHAQFMVEMALRSDNPGLAHSAGLVDRYIRAARAHAAHGGVAHAAVGAHAPPAAPAIRPAP